MICNRWGPTPRRLGATSEGARVVGLRPVKLHGLRHAAGSILARVADPVFVRDYLGHSKLSTTDRYVSAKHRPEDFDRLNRAFAAASAAMPAEAGDEFDSAGTGANE